MTLCGVCGDQVLYLNSYGGQVCSSCRAFFRRAVKSKKIDEKCDKYPSCSVNKETRTKCKPCRFQRCKEAGMKEFWVLSKTDREEIFCKKRILTKEVKSMVTETGSLLSAKYPRDLITNEELLFLERLKITGMDNIRCSIDRYFQCDQKVFLGQLASHAYFSSKEAFSHDFYTQFVDMCKKMHSNFYSCIQDLNLLPIQDQTSLISTNGPIVYRFNYYPTIVDGSNLFLEMLDREVKSGRLSSINPKLDLVGEEMKPKIYLESIYCSPWLPSREEELKFMETVNRIRSWPISSKGSFDEISWILMKILLLFADRVILTKPEVAAQIRKKYKLLLYRYLKNIFGDKEGMKKFEIGNQMFHYTLELDQISHRRLPI